MTTLLAALALAMPTPALQNGQSAAIALDDQAMLAAGLRLTTISLPEGNVVIYLPARLAAGDRISGSIFVNPTGDTNALRSKNDEILRSQLIEVNGVAMPVTATQFTTMVSPSGNLTFVVHSADGANSAKASVDVSSAPTATQLVDACPVVEMGQPLRIVGNFDGNRDTTEVSVDGREVGILAESPRECVIAPEANLGAHKLSVRDGMLALDRTVNLVSVSVKTPESAVLGRKTKFELIVDGLENADSSAFPLSLVISSTTPKLLSFGEEAKVSINPADIRDGQWKGTLEFKPLKRGTYSLRARLACDAFLSTIR